MQVAVIVIFIGIVYCLLIIFFITHRIGLTLQITNSTCFALESVNESNSNSSAHYMNAAGVASEVWYGMV